MSTKIRSNVTVRTHAPVSEHNWEFARALHSLANAVADCREPVDRRSLEIEIYRQQSMGDGLDFEIDIEIIQLTVTTTKETP